MLLRGEKMWFVKKISYLNWDEYVAKMHALDNFVWQQMARSTFLPS
jgi:hypothetical protein